jgi:hypothetical protein
MRSLLRKSVVRNFLLLSATGVAAMAAPQFGCSSGASQSSEPASGSQDGTGVVGMQLTLPAESN